MHPFIPCRSALSMVMTRNPPLCLLLALIGIAGVAEAQMPIPHELLGHKRSTFKVPRARAWDEENYKYFGGGPDLDCECGGAGHCFHRPAVWTCPEYIVPPYTATWIIRGEGLGMSREDEDHQGILFRTTDDAELFSMSDFDFDQSPAYRVSAQRNFGEHFGVELVYLRVHDELEDYRIVDDIDDIELIPGLVVPNVPVDLGEPYDLLYSTRFQSGEINLRYNYNYFAASAFAGFRWLDIDEHFRVRGDDGATELLTVSTRNKLVGGQIGMETQHWVNYGILRIDASIRGGIYENTSEQITQGVALSTARGTDLAWVGESEVAANFPITKHTYLRVTYRLIHVAGLALAADQINTPVDTIYNDADAIYHGWSVGLEAWW